MNKTFKKAAITLGIAGGLAGAFTVGNNAGHNTEKSKAEDQIFAARNQESGYQYSKDHRISYWYVSPVFDPESPGHGKIIPARNVALLNDGTPVAYTNKMEGDYGQDYLFTFARAVQLSRIESESLPVLVDKQNGLTATGKLYAQAHHIPPTADAVLQSGLKNTNAILKQDEEQRLAREQKEKGCAPQLAANVPRP